MALSVAISVVQTFPTSVQMVAVPAGQTPPVTYQWYRSFDPTFTPGAGNIIPGATSANFTDTNLIPGSTYNYKVVATDAAPSTATSANQSVPLPAGTPLDPNQFQQIVIRGMLDQGYNTGTFGGLLIPTYGGSPVVAGQAMKRVNPAQATFKLNTLQNLTPCTADSDPVDGFVVYSQKDQSFLAGDRMSIAAQGDVMYLVATANGNEGDFAQLDVNIPGGVAPVVTSSGARIVGTFMDRPYVGQLVRVQLSVPSLNLA